MVRLIPKDNSFFTMFSAMSDNLISGAQDLVDLFANYRDVAKKIEKIHTIERAGDELTHAILTKLNQTFITPFDREDIHELVGGMDDIVDTVDAIAKRITLYHLKGIKSWFLKQADVLVQATIVVNEAMHRLRKARNHKRRATGRAAS